MRMGLLLFVLFLIQTGPLHADSKQSDGSLKPATLSVWNREIVTFRSMLSSLTPEQRRDMSLQRIQDLPRFAMYKPVVWQKSDLGDVHGAVFTIDDHLLFALLEADLDAAAGKTLAEAAEVTKARMEAVRSAILSQRNWKVILGGLAFSFAMTLGLAIFFWGLIKFTRLARRFFVRRTARMNHLKTRDLDLRPVLLQTMRWLVRLTLAIIGFVALFLWITGVLSQFPYTEAWGAVLGRDLIRLAEDLLKGFIEQLPGLIIVALIVFFTRESARLIDQVLQSFEKANRDDHFLTRDTARATRRIAWVLIWVVGAVIAYPYIPGSDSTAFKGVGVLVGLIVSLGSTGVVNQIVSGFVALYTGAVRTGEYAKIGDVEGLVHDIGLLSTKIQTPKNEYITVPNAVLITKEVINYSRQTGEHRTRLSVVVTIGYSTSWQQVHDLLMAAANQTPGIRKIPEPLVIQKALSDFYVEYNLTFVPVDITKKVFILSELHKRIQDAFHQAGVQIMSPHFNTQPKSAMLPDPKTPLKQHGK